MQCPVKEEKVGPFLGNSARPGQAAEISRQDIGHQWKSRLRTESGNSSHPVTVAGLTVPGRAFVKKEIGKQRRVVWIPIVLVRREKVELSGDDMRPGRRPVAVLPEQRHPSVAVSRVDCSIPSGLIVEQYAG